MTPELEEILNTYKTKNNKELSTISIHLFNDFNAIKESLLILTTNMTEIKTVYEKVYAELQERLKFETPDEKRDN